MDIFEQDESVKTLFAEVLLPVPIPRTFTYRIPVKFNTLVRPGQRVIVQLGDRKILTGLIVTVHENPPKEHEAKYLLEILDDYPSVSEVQLRFFNWMAEY